MAVHDPGPVENPLDITCPNEAYHPLEFKPPKCYGWMVNTLEHPMLVLSLKPSWLYLISVYLPG
jgi:hypothetical protein